MSTELPPVPADLWTDVRPATAQDRAVVEKGVGYSVDYLAAAVARCVCQEMRNAGKQTAVAEFLQAEPVGCATAQVRANLHAHSAARLLALFEALQRKATPKARAVLPSAGELKGAATLSYREGLRDERDMQQQTREMRGPAPYNDELYELIRRRTGRGAKPKP